MDTLYIISLLSLVSLAGLVYYRIGHTLRTGFFPVLMMYMTLSAGTLCSCEEGKEHIAPAIRERDSVSMMVSYGVNTLISDSGVIKYRIVAERWDVNTVKNPPRWTFIKGIFLEQFDDKFHVKAYVQADTAWYYDQQKLWELRGRVSMRNVNGLIFKSEELFWDGIRHELYSYKFSRLVTPERTLQGTYFRSDEGMTHYTVSNSKGSFIKSDMDGSPSSPLQPSAEDGKKDSAVAAEAGHADTASVVPAVRQAAKAHAAKNKK